MNVYLKNSAKEIEITQLKKKILLNPATKKVNYISKEQAAESYVSEIGEDFISFLGYNPLLDVIDIFFNASFVNNQTLSSTKIDIESFDFVDEVVYDKPLIRTFRRECSKNYFWFIVFYFTFYSYCSSINKQFNKVVYFLKTFCNKNHATSRGKKILYQETLHPK